MDEQMPVLRARIAELRAEARPGDLKLYKHVGAEVVLRLPEWRAEGLTYAEIARLAGISDTSIHGWLRRSEQEGLLPAVRAGATGRLERVSADPSSQGRSSGTATREPVVAIARRLVAVQVGGSQVEAGGLSMVSPSGYRVEGLSLPGALYLLRELS